LSTTDLNKHLKELYKKWPEIRRFLKTLGCDAVAAEDIFQEALLIYSRRIQSPDFVLTVEPVYYVRNTCKLLWYNQARKEQKYGEVALEKDVAAVDDEWFAKEMKLRRVEQAMEQLGEQCRELLQLFYGLGWSMVDIAKKIGLRNDKVAKAQKYRCLQKTKELVEQPVLVESSNR